MKESTTLQTIKNDCTIFHYFIVIDTILVDVNLIIFRRNYHQENCITAAPDDKKVVQEDQNSN